MGKYKTSDFFKKELEIIVFNLYKVKNNYDIFLNISSGENYYYFCDRFSHLSNAILNSLFDSTIISIYKTIADYNKIFQNTLSLEDIKRIYNSNKKITKEKKTYEIKNGKEKIELDLNPTKIPKCFSKIVLDQKKYLNVSNFIKYYRNKQVAHLDKETYFEKDMKISNLNVKYSELEEYINIMYEDTRELYRSITGSSLMYNNDSLEDLNYISKIIKNDYIEYREKTFGKVIDVVAALIYKEDKVLIAKRSTGDPNVLGKWEFPGGKVKKDETEENAIKREIKKEFEVEIETKRYITHNIKVYPQKTVDLKLYECEYISGEFNLHDHSEYIWVKPEKLLSYDLAPADIPLAEKVEVLK